MAGPLYRPGSGFTDGWLRIEEGRIADAGDGPPPAPPDVEGVVIPEPINAHTHVGDFIARGHDISGMSLGEVVAPPDGLKHRILRDTPRERLVAGMVDAAAEMRAVGCRAFLDFREQGRDGALALREAVDGTASRPLVFGRAHPEWTDDALDDVLRVADGIGYPSLGDPGDAARAADAARRHGKPFVIHFSESRREDIDALLELRPAFVVHACRATRDDIAALADARVPIVTCPRSNALFGERADVETMLELGVTVAVGTDNAMFHDLDPVNDARVLARRVGRAAALDALVSGGRAVRDGMAPREDAWYAPGADAAFVVFEPRGEDPWAALFGEAPPVVRHVGWRASAGPAKR